VNESRDQRPPAEKPGRVVACSYCQGPVMTDTGTCRSCGTTLSGTESRYIPQQDTGPDIPGLIKWWFIWSLAVFVLSGFSWGRVSSLLFALVSTVYLVRILRAVYR
jgi:hypothetical protein